MTASIAHTGVDAPLTAVLPIALSDTGRPGSDLDRVSLLLQSLQAMADARTFERLFVVTRASDMRDVSTCVSDYRGLRPEVIDERDFCPALRTDPESGDVWPAPNKGWYRQQLIKLAAFEHVRTPFYLTLDSDVIFVRPFTADDLVVDGRGWVNIERRPDFDRLWVPAIADEAVDLHRRRHGWSSRVLRLPERTGEYFYGETPVVLSMAIARAFSEYITTHIAPDWQAYLLRERPWTEYNLYFSFAEWAGLFDHHHRMGHADSVLRLSDSLWLESHDYKDGRSLDTWQPDGPRERGGVAVVVQSYLGYAPGLVKQKARALFPHVFGPT